MNPQPHPEDTLEYGYYYPTKVDKNGEQYPGDRVFGAYTPDGEYGWVSRYQVGEVVYIKEAHKPFILCFPGVNKTLVRYKLDDTDVEVEVTEEIKQQYYSMACLHTEAGLDICRWVSPLFMPAWAARYHIKIKDVRAERLQEIGSWDCVHEGICQKFFNNMYNIVTDKPNGMLIRDFYRLWDSINKDKWESNPWVFRYEFEPC